MYISVPFGKGSEDLRDCSVQRVGGAGHAVVQGCIHQKIDAHEYSPDPIEEKAESYILQIPNLRQKAGKTIYPMKAEYSELWIRFSSLPSDPRSFVRFADEYGLLGINAIPENHGLMLDSFPDPQFKDLIPIYTVTIAEKVEDWSQESNTLRQAKRLWEAIQDEDADFIKRHLKKAWIRVLDDDHLFGGVSKDFLYFLDWPAQDVDTTRKVPGEVRRVEEYLRGASRRFILSSATDFLVDLINTKLDDPRSGRIRYRFYVEKESHKGETQPPAINQQVLPESLLAAMWYHFGMATTGRREYRRCDECGEWMDITESRSDTRYHKSCGNKKRQRERLEALKAKALQALYGGAPMSEVTALVGKSESMIERWHSEHKDDLFKAVAVFGASLTELEADLETLQRRILELEVSRKSAPEDHLAEYDEYIEDAYRFLEHGRSLTAIWPKRLTEWLFAGSKINVLVSNPEEADDTFFIRPLMAEIESTTVFHEHLQRLSLELELLPTSLMLEDEEAKKNKA